MIALFDPGVAPVVVTTTPAMEDHPTNLQAMALLACPHCPRTYLPAAILRFEAHVAACARGLVTDRADTSPGATAPAESAGPPTRSQVLDHLRLETGMYRCLCGRHLTPYRSSLRKHLETRPTCRQLVAYPESDHGNLLDRGLAWRAAIAERGVSMVRLAHEADTPVAKMRLAIQVTHAAPALQRAAQQEVLNHNQLAAITEITGDHTLQAQLTAAFLALRAEGQLPTKEEGAKIVARQILAGTSPVRPLPAPPATTSGVAGPRESDREAIIRLDSCPACAQLPGVPHPRCPRCTILVGPHHIERTLLPLPRPLVALAAGEAWHKTSPQRPICEGCVQELAKWANEAAQQQRKEAA